MLTFGFKGLVVGFLLDRHGPIHVYTFGLLLIITGLSISSTLDSLWTFRITQGLMMGFGAASLSTVSMTTLLSRWFKHYLGTAIAFAYTSMGLGVMLF